MSFKCNRDDRILLLNVWMLFFLFWKVFQCDLVRLLIHVLKKNFKCQVHQVGDCENEWMKTDAQQILDMS